MISERKVKKDYGFLYLFCGDNELTILDVENNYILIEVLKEHDLNSGNLFDLYIFNLYESKFDKVELYNFELHRIGEKEFTFLYKLILCKENFDVCREKVGQFIVNSDKNIKLRMPDNIDMLDTFTFFDEQADYWYKKFLNKNKDASLFKDVSKKTELALNLSNQKLYTQFLQNDFNDFCLSCLESLYLKEHSLFLEPFTRIYVGNEFCFQLFPEIETLIKILEKAKEHTLNVTVVFPYLRENDIETARSLLKEVEKLSKNNNLKIEVIISDWGMLEMINSEFSSFIPVLGRLFNKVLEKDPRVIPRTINDDKLLGGNCFLDELVIKSLKKYGIHRYEYEGLAKKIRIADGNHSLHLPYFQVSTGTNCQLYLLSKNDEDNMFSDCPHHCLAYSQLYPKDTNMVGKGNTVFGFSDELLNDANKLSELTNAGIDRIVLSLF